MLQLNKSRRNNMEISSIKSIGLLVTFWATIVVNLYGQSSSQGSMYISGNAEAAIFGSHDFVNGSGTLGNGIIATDRTSINSVFSWVAGSSWTNASDVAFVDGYAKKYGSGSFIFPIGDNGKYRPAAISGMVNSTDATMAAYYLANPSSAITSNISGGNHGVLPSGGPFAISSKGSDLSNVSSVEYWDIDGVNPVKITLTYDNNSNASLLTSNNINTLSIVGWNGSQWVKIPSTVDATSITGGTSSITSGSITTNAAIIPNTYSVYTLASINAASLDITINLKVLLQGALLGITNGLMRSSLVGYVNNTNNPFPLNQPYLSSLSARFTPVSGGTEITNSSVISANTGTGNAIVDWIFIEFRDATTPTTILKTISALLQSDGDIVDASTGGSIITNGLPSTFYVSVKHRNHLGVMTASPLSTSNSTITFDFTTAPDSDIYNISASYDGLERATDINTGKKLLWAGNANADTRTKYDGAANDRLIISNNVIGFSGNSGGSFVYNNALGYFMGDINLDGKVKYDGLGNDRILVQQIIQTYPLNTGVLNNYNNMLEQLPQ
jgi:hypothetical protein